MGDIHKRVSRRIQNFLWNNKGADRVAAEVIQMVAEQGNAHRLSADLYAVAESIVKHSRGILVQAYLDEARAALAQADTRRMAETGTGSGPQGPSGTVAKPCAQPDAPKSPHPSPSREASK